MDLKSLRNMIKGIVFKRERVPVSRFKNYLVLVVITK